MFQSVLIIFRVLLNINKAYYTICSSAEQTSSTLLQIVCIKYNFNQSAFVLLWELFIDARA